MLVAEGEEFLPHIRLEPGEQVAVEMAVVERLELMEPQIRAVEVGVVALRQHHLEMAEPAAPAS
jgi:hypothetical protein